MWTNKEALIVGLSAAVIFISLCSFNIEGQGLYFDEVHQAPAAFVLFGKDVPDGMHYAMNVALKWHKIPLLTRPYSGAIKSIIYGLFLKLTHRPFTVTSWRLLGIVFIALGLLLFCMLTYNRLGRMGMVLFFLFILTDTTVLLTSRHDWGPTSLALMLRLLWLAVWIQGELGRVTLTNSLLLGAIIGLAIYEKLSSAVLLFPMLIVNLMNKTRQRKPHWLACAAGIIIGAMPLILINVWSFVQYRSIYSLGGWGDITNLKSCLSSIINIIYGRLNQFKYYLGLGNGTFVREWILGQSISPPSELLEAIFISIIILTFGIIGLLNLHRNLFFRASTIMFFCYLTIWIGLILLPKDPYVHHLLIGTPFQYLGAVLCLLGIKAKGRACKMTSMVLTSLFIFAIIALLLYRLPILASTEYSLRKGDTNVSWDVSSTKLAKFASRHQGDSFFLDAGGLLGMPIYSLSNGADNLVYQLPGGYDCNDGGDFLRKLIESSGKGNVYLVLGTHWKPDSFEAEIFSRTIEIVKQMPELYEEPLEPELANFKRVKCIKYRYKHEN